MRMTASFLWFILGGVRMGFGRTLAPGVLGSIRNVIWLILACIWLAIGYVCSALFNFITHIGILFGIQHLKMAGIVLSPIGMTIVSKEVSASARKANDELTIAAFRVPAR